MTDDAMTEPMTAPASVGLRGAARVRPGGPGAPPRARVTRTWSPPDGPHRPGVAPRGAGDLARRGSDPDPPRAHDGLAVHVLPRRRAADGRGPRPHAEQRADRAAVRRRAPVELRSLRQRRAPPRVRHQRLRRDASGPFRVGCQAPRREHRDRRTLPRLHRRGAPGDQARRRRAAIASGCCAPRNPACSRPGTTTSTSSRCRSWLQSEREEERRREAADQELRRRRGEGAHARQHAGVLEARLERGRAACASSRIRRSSCRSRTSSRTASEREDT